MHQVHISFSILLSGIIFLNACSTKSKTDDGAAAEPVEQQGSDTASAESSADDGAKAATFDISSLPVSEAELGDFPFFTLPDGIKEQNKAYQSKYDRLVLPLNGKMTSLEGKVYRTYLISEGSEPWSLAYAQKSFDDAIVSRGGKMVYEGKVSSDEIKRVSDLMTYAGSEGSADYWNEPVRVYAIRRADNANVYIQISGNSASGNLQIIQEQGFKQTIKTIKAEEIKRDLDSKGKAVLYINFDTDKATLKAEGSQVVDEIKKVMDQDKALKLEVNGYTDNAGTPDHNLKLSKDRAAAVVNALTGAGVGSDRLTPQGFGQDAPIADNATEEGRAKNRRVELLSKNFKP